MTKADKVKQISACPACQEGLKTEDSTAWSCPNCHSTFPLVEETPLLVMEDSPFRELMLQRKTYDPSAHGILHRLHMLMTRPEERAWSKQSKRAIDGLLEEFPPDDADKCVMNVGAGFEKIFEKVLGDNETFLRVGLPHTGEVELFGDAMQFPIKNDCVDLAFSSSVMEHLRDPEKAANELFRIMKPGGKVYAEIPFMRAYHMAPYDFQRYTISGIEALFERQGFELVEKGVCSGPFTAFALIIRDFTVSITPGRRLKNFSSWLSSWLVQPIKWLDGLANTSDWAADCACNFYYVGRKPE